MKIGRNDPCWCGSGRKYKACHQAFDEKIELFRSEGHRVPPHKIIKNKDQIAGMKASAAINIAVLDYVGEHIHAGMSTEEIDKMVYERTTAMGGIPAPLHYQGFPKSVCTSINEQVCHGIPSEEDILKEGDIVNVDCSTILNYATTHISRIHNKRQCLYTLFRYVHLLLKAILHIFPPDRQLVHGGIFHWIGSVFQLMCSLVVYSYA